MLCQDETRQNEGNEYSMARVGTTYVDYFFVGVGVVDGHHFDNRQRREQAG